MSASLVGSEMCIRDSTVVHLFTELVPIALAGLAEEPLERGPAIMAHEVPVSYTHLTLPTICSV
eukprot:3967825-Alexandrium_andersonii.AAC.1